MSVNYEILKKAKNEKGEPFNIIKVPLPDLIVQPIKILEAGAWEDSYNVPISAFKESDGWTVGDTAYRVAASSYLNYYVTNGAVLFPTYIKQGSSPEKEERIKKYLQRFFLAGNKFLSMQ